ncbi:MFS transporter [Nonomuraea sp. B10E15]|uniref:MFS transporter n=1 Tax=Nonomuraea sp. B10E15 TaxID=3153560 RepID=UPI00325F3392
MPRRSSWHRTRVSSPRSSRRVTRRVVALLDIAFTLTEVSGFAATTVPWLLILFGCGLFVGNLAGGKAADRWTADGTLAVVFTALAVVLAAFALTARSQAMTLVSLLLMGAFGFATVPGLQMRIMHYAGRAETLASGSNIAAFNVGNALGAWLGGLTIGAGLGFTSPVWAGTGLTIGAVAVLAVAARLAVRPAQRIPRAMSPAPCPTAAASPTERPAR